MRREVATLGKCVNFTSAVIRCARTVVSERAYPYHLSVRGGAFNLPSLLAMEERRFAAGLAGKAKHVLLLYLHGGAPTQDIVVGTQS